MDLAKIKEIFKELGYVGIHTEVFGSSYTFQKPVTDEKGIKYFLDFNYYEKIGNLKPTLELMTQFTKDENMTINVSIFSIILTEDITEKEIVKNIKKYEKEVEKIFDKMGYDYYEKK